MLHPGETGTAETKGGVPNGEFGSEVAVLSEAENGGFGGSSSDAVEDSAVPAVAYMEVRPVASEAPAVDGPPRVVGKAVERAV